MKLFKIPAKLTTWSIWLALGPIWFKMVTKLLWNICVALGLKWSRMISKL